MKSNETKILEYFLEQGAFQNSKEEGIAKLAIDKGYDTLTTPQQAVLKPFFNPICQGDLIHKDCTESVSNEEFVLSIEDYFMLDRISCRSCLEQAEYQYNSKVGD